MHGSELLKIGLTCTDWFEMKIKVYMTNFFIYLLADKYNKKIYPIACFFLISVFNVPKTWNFTSGGVQNGKTKNRRLGMIVRSFQDFKLRRKQISLTFSYFLINNALLYHFWANLLAHNKKMTERLRSLNPSKAIAMAICPIIVHFST